MHLAGQAFGRFPVKAEAETVGLGPFSFPV